MESSINGSSFPTQQDIQKDAYEKNTLDNQEDKISSEMATSIATRIKYRTGSPILPVLPVETIDMSLRNVNNKFPDWETHRERIGEILDQNGITRINTVMQYRFHAGSELHDDYITIVT
ncbi:hypothetical protein K458DRAFT_386382 [Lentithecium fluviatile CBS 122367]|uniref:Uncharacterized protein n=1 Tax=Lentithecium fluviatile CBS 122367 TaxID=1168545 RepID=A0A6G1JBR0_9PLEO|nr:hypothetical protein K458DRAFT_386382 [Lentithecium fluviatile CBS 122367]